jgi:hypothetical protein
VACLSKFFCFLVKHAENRLDLDRNLIGQAAKANGGTRMLATITQYGNEKI